MRKIYSQYLNAQNVQKEVIYKKREIITIEFKPRFLPFDIIHAIYVFRE
jgi:hypothetical protein